MKPLWFVVLFAACPYYMVAQQLSSNDEDSAKLVVATRSNKEDTLKAKAYLEYAKWWMSRNNDSCHYYNNIGAVLSDKLNFINGKFYYLNTEISVSQITGDNDNFLVYSKRMLDTASKYNNAKFLIRGYLMYGTAQNALGNTQDYLDYHIKAEELAESSGMLNEYPQIPYNIGMALSQMGESLKAIPYVNKSIELCKRTNNTQYLSVSYYNMGSVFSGLDSFAAANAYYEKSIETAEKINYDQLKAASLVAIASNLSSLNQPAKGLEYAEKGLKLATETDYDFAVMLGYFALFENYLELNKYKEAEYYGTKALSMGNDMNADFDMYKDMRLFSELQAKMGNYKSANEYLLKYYKIKDEVEKKQVKDKINQLEIQYRTEKKEKQIVELEKAKEKQTLLVYVLIGGIILLGLIAFLISRNIYIRRKNAEERAIQLEQEKQLIATTSILQGQEAERTRMAKDLHDGLGGMLSGIKLNLSSVKGNMVIQETDAQLFNKSIAQLDNAIAEMRRVAHNMMPEALLKFGLNEAIQDYCDNINESNTVKMKYTHLNLQQPLEKSTEVIFYRMIQELSNNAIKYASANNIFIQLEKHAQTIMLTVEDDGKGFDITEIKKGAGLSNVQSRVDYLKGIFTIHSSAGIGTSVSIEIPV